MTVYKIEYAAHLIGPTERALSVLSGTASMNTTSTPHVLADLRIAAPGEWMWTALPAGLGDVPVWAPDPDLLDDLDPRNSPRIRITATRDIGAQQRTFDLTVRDRTVDPDDGTVSLTLASDESLAIDYAPLEDDTTPFLHQASLRAVCDYVLGRVPGVRRNLAPFPTGGVGAGWSAFAGTGGALDAYPTNATNVPNLPSPTPLNSLAVVWTTAPAAGAQPYLIAGRFPVPEGGPLTVSLYSASNIAGSSWQLAVVWYDAAGNVLYVTYAPTWGTEADMGNRWALTATPPVDAVTMEPVLVHVGGPLPTVGAFAYITALQVELGTHASPWAEDVLALGTLDADLTAYWPVTNLMPNPAVRGVIGNWIAGGANGVLSRETGWAGATIGGDDLTVTTATLTTFTGNSGLGQGGAVSQTAAAVPYAPVQPGKTYTVYCRVLSSDAKPLRLAAQIFGADGAVLSGGTDIVASQLVPAGEWTWMIGTVTTPANASRLGPFVYPAAGSQWTNGQTLRTTKWMVHEGVSPVRVPWFDGATPADAHYAHVASGAAHASAATRQPLVDGTDPDALVWRAGQSAMEFLLPLVQANGFRLVCDESREWTLRDENYEAPGALTLRYGVNITGADEAIRRDDEQWFDARVTRYKWIDDDGIQRERTDSYALPGYSRVSLLEVAAGYPGPGRSEYAVRRAQGRGREVVVSAVSDLSVRAEQPVTVVLPNTPTQLGNIASLEFDFSTDEMTITTRAIDIGEGAIALLTGSINALTGPINNLGA